MRIVGINLASDAAVAVLRDGYLDFVGEVGAVSYDPPGSEAPADGFATTLARHGVAIEDVDRFVLTGWNGGHIFRPQHYAVECFGNLDGPEETAGETMAEKTGEGRIGGSLVSYTSRRYVTAQAAGAYAMMKRTPLTRARLVVTWTPRTPMQAFLVKRGEVKLINDELLGFTSSILTVLPYYFGPLRSEAVIEGSRDFLTERLVGNWRDAERAIAFAAFGTVHDGLLGVLKKAAARIAEEPDHNRKSAIVAGAWSEHSVFAAASLYCREKGIGDATALRTILTWIDDAAAAGMRRLVGAYAPEIVFAGGALATNRLATALRDAAGERAFHACPIQGGALAAVGAAVLEHWKTAGSGDAIFSRITCGPQFENFFAPAVPASNPEEIADLLADNPTEPVVVVYGHAAVGPRSLGRRSVFGHPAFSDSLFKLNRFRAQNARGDVPPTALDLIVLDESSAGFFERGVFDEFAQYSHEVGDALLRAAPAACGVDRRANVQTVPAWGDHFLLRVLRRFHERTGLPFLASVALRRPDGGEYLTTTAVIGAARSHSVRHAWVDYSLFDTTKGDHHEQTEEAAD